jgi:hypothetical protein
MRKRFWCSIGLVVGCAVLAAGCNGTSRSEYNTPERLDNGLVLLLPGIEGEGPLSYAVRAGLNEAGGNQALSIYNWGWPIPVAGMMLNQVDVIRARRVAKAVAREVVKYQTRHPGRPVHLVGHSGGGAIAIFAAEELPSGHSVDGIVLLSPSISADYNLVKALAHSRKGIVHFWSPGDVALLVLGTTLFGNLDGGHGPAAGAIGFARGGSFGKLYQTEWTAAMLTSGNMGGHMGSAGNHFVREWVAPWVMADRWPVEKKVQPQYSPQTTSE